MYATLKWIIPIFAALVLGLTLLVASVQASPIRSVQCGSSGCIDGSNFPQCTGWNGVPAGTVYYPGDGTGWICTWNQGWVRFN